MKSQRAQQFVGQCLLDLQQRPTVRNAQRCKSPVEITWNAVDLYTVAVDLCDDSALRFLVAQARCALVLALIKRSAHLK